MQSVCWEVTIAIVSFCSYFVSLSIVCNGCCIWQDVSDLFGCDLPVEGGKSVRFAWRDGPLLRALKAGDWILLDEVSTVIQSAIFFSIHCSCCHPCITMRHPDSVCICNHPADANASNTMLADNILTVTYPET